MEVGDAFGDGEGQGDDRETADDPEQMYSSVLEELCDVFNSSATNVNYPPGAGSNGGIADDSDDDDFEWVDVGELEESDCDREGAEGAAEGANRPWELDVPLEYAPRENGEPAGRRHIWELHEDHMQDATVVEGGAKNLLYNKGARDSEYYPHRNLSLMLLNLFADKHQLSRAVIEGLLTMLRLKDANGDKFNIEDLSGVHHEHFRARSRRYAPLLLHIKRKVRCSATAKAAGETEAYVHEIPSNLIIDRKLRSESAVREMMVNQGGKTLTAAESNANGLASELVISSCPEVREGNARSSNHHGRLMRESPHVGLDGILGQDRPHGSSRRVHVNDIAMVKLDGIESTQPCRVLSLA